MGDQDIMATVYSGFVTKHQLSDQSHLVSKMQKFLLHIHDS